jgi:hypothetical protein
MDCRKGIYETRSYLAEAVLSMKNIMLKSKNISKAFVVATLLGLPSLASAQFALPIAAIVETVGSISDLATMTNDLSEIGSVPDIDAVDTEHTEHTDGLLDASSLADGFDVLQGVILLSALSTSNTTVLGGFANGVD